MATTLAKHLTGMVPKSTRQDGDVPQAWWYRGADSVTLYQRIGKRDVKVGRYALAAFAPEQAAATFRAARKLARDTIDGAAIAAAASPTPPRGPGRPAGQLGTGATWGDVWAEFRKRVEASGKWGARTKSQNDHRIARHLAGSPPDKRGQRLEAIAPHPLWGKPMATTGAHDVEAVLAPLRASLPGEERKLRGLLNLTVATAWAMQAMPTSNDPVAGALRLMRATSNAPTKNQLPAVTNVAELRNVLERIAEMPASFELRAALKLQAFTGHRSDRIMAAEWRHFHAPRKPGESWRWITPRELMKIKRNKIKWDHVLVLPAPVVALLESLPSFKDRAKGGWLFPSPRSASGHITNLDGPMRELLGKGIHVPHGWRSAIKTRALSQTTKHANGLSLPMFNKYWVDAVTDHKPQGIDEHYVREQAVEGGAAVLDWWCTQLAGKGKGHNHKT